MITIGGIARRMVDLFWPLVVDAAGFARTDQPPVFLTLETSQYYMARIVRPLLDEGFFGSLTIDRNRLYSQVIDNLNKSAAVGFPFTEIGSRLDAAWFGDPAQRRIYADAQECASRFRKYCLEHNLLDFSLQLEIFRDILWRTPLCREYLARQYRHLIYDNAEEDIPVIHDILCEWLPDMETALVIQDSDGGYRRFLGADPGSALRLSDLCDHREKLETSFVVNGGIAHLSSSLARRIAPDEQISPVFSTSTEKPGSALETIVFPPADPPVRFVPQMLDWVAAEIHHLVADLHLPPSEIAVLAPYLSDALRFSLHVRLDELGIPWRSHRPSRSLRDEPASRCLLTLAALAHPDWGIRPAKFDVAYALLFALEDMDLVRAQLLAEIVYRQRDMTLTTFDRIQTDVQERITFVHGGNYTKLRDWLLAYREEQPLPLDYFLRRLFGELLTEKGFGFNRNVDAARVAASLIESVEKFRQAMDASGEPLPVLEMGKDYLQMLADGVIAAQYIESWKMEDTDSVLLAPAYTFLMINHPVTVQFWLDVGSPGWWERLSQPLTQPYILSRAWMEREPGSLWTDADEVASNQQALASLLTGLLRRCRERIYVGLSDLDASGYEQRGPLLKAIWKLQMEDKNE
jgi:hypothetical protein